MKTDPEKNRGWKEVLWIAIVIVAILIAASFSK